MEHFNIDLVKEEYLAVLKIWEENVIEHGKKDLYDYVLDLVKEAEDMSDFEAINSYFDDPAALDMDRPELQSYFVK